MAGVKPGGNHMFWDGGIYYDEEGYQRVLVSSKNYYPLHRLIMEWHLKRKLNEDEIVHHVNEIKDDNRIENLKIVCRSRHLSLHRKGAKASAKTKSLLRKIRKGTNQKENHQQWKTEITKATVLKAINSHKTKKEAAAFLGIHPDTLRARLKYYNNKKEY